MVIFFNFQAHQVIFTHYKPRIAIAIHGLQGMKMTMVNAGLKGLKIGTNISGSETETHPVYRRH